MKHHKGSVFLGLILATLIGLLAGRSAMASPREVLANSAGTVLATSTDALTTAVSGGYGSYHYGITYAAITTNSVIHLMVNDGVGTRPLALNGGTACTAGVIYRQEFDFPGAWTLNIQVATLTTPVFAIVKEKN